MAMSDSKTEDETNQLMDIIVTMMSEMDKTSTGNDQLIRNISCVKLDLKDLESDKADLEGQFKNTFGLAKTVKKEEEPKVKPFIQTKWIKVNKKTIVNPLPFWANVRGNNLDWYLDSRWSRHKTGENKNFLSLTALQGGSVSFKNEKKGQITGIGKVGKSLSHAIEDVYYVEGLKHNILSISQMRDKENEAKFNSKICTVTKLNIDEIVLKGKRHNNVYKISIMSLPQNEHICFSVMEDDPLLWHRNLAHASLSQLSKLAAKDSVLGLLKVEFTSDKVCDACVREKHVRSSFKSKKVVSTTKPLELLHMNLCGPMRVRSRGGKRCMVRPILDKTSYELLRGRKPNITHLRAFGCKYFVHNNGKESLGLQDEDYDIGLTDEGVSKEPEHQSEDGSGDPKELESDHEEQEEEKTTLTANQIDEVVPTDIVPLDHSLGEPSLGMQIRPWKHQSSHPLENIIFDPNRPKNRTVIGTRWVFRNKLDEQGNITRNKDKLVVQGYNQEESIDYDETFAHVARMEVIRMLIAFVSHIEFTLDQMDVKSAFLNGYLKEEVLVKQPPGFESEEFPDYVFKLDKAMYGLKQAPRAWYEKLSKFLLTNNFVREKVDITLFLRSKGKNVLIVQIYVDDIIFGATNEAMCKEFAEMMGNEYDG
ncbi:uncharacterized protein LOC142177266 [Nicotiana tabacum]|uniref:Uncharacterized protein LOC142177266 n=1 Tax=Nicotiana tabacum TaxID=4097 RepID=A0AC58TXD4_TOBAC